MGHQPQQAADLGLEFPGFGWLGGLGGVAHALDLVYAIVNGTSAILGMTLQASTLAIQGASHYIPQANLP